MDDLVREFPTYPGSYLLIILWYNAYFLSSKELRSSWIYKSFKHHDTMTPGCFESIGFCNNEWKLSLMKESHRPMRILSRTLTHFVVQMGLPTRITQIAASTVQQQRFSRHCASQSWGLVDFQNVLITLCISISDNACVWSHSRGRVPVPIKCHPHKVVTGWGCDMHAQYVSIRCFSGVYEHFIQQNTERIPCAYCTVGKRGISRKRVLWVTLKPRC